MDPIGHHSIVVGIDDSMNSDAALEWAVAEGTRRNLPLHLFSAGIREFPTGESMYMGAQMATFTAEALASIDARLEAAAAHARELSPQLHVTTGRAVDAAAANLVELSSHADSVVLGRSGHGPVAGFVLGSVALQVVTHAQCPVVVVHPSSKDDADARGVVVGIDGSGASETALGWAFEQASLRGAPLDVVHAWWTTSHGGLTQPIIDNQVNEERLGLSEALVGWSEKYPDVKVSTHLPLGPAALTLVEAAKNAELLVVGSRGLGGFRSLLLGSVSQGVLHHATCTVAIVRAHTSTSGTVTGRTAVEKTS